MAVSPDALYLSLLRDFVSTDPAIYGYLDDLLNVDARYVGEPDMPLDRFRKLHCLSSLRKKCVDEIDVLADARGLQKFLAVNASLDFRPPVADSYLDEVLTYAKHRLYRTWDTFSTSRSVASDVLSNIGFGPGSSRGCKGTSFYDKLESPVAFSGSKNIPRALRSAYQLLPRWKAAMSGDHPVEFVELKGSSLFTVVKNTEESRIAMTECQGNMQGQKGVGKVFEEFLLFAYGIDLSRQQVTNRRLCYHASLHGDRATVDMTSASDTVGFDFSKWYLHPEMFFWCNLFRSPWCEVPDSLVKYTMTNRIRLRMMSTMGNGFTFPLQSIIFASLLVEVYDQLNIKVKYGKHTNLAINGDDVILDKRAYPLFIALLRRCGFIPNEKKSFATGFFRESCGGDYLHGHPVRGVYLKSLETKQDIVIAVNKLVRWSCEMEIPVHRAIDTLMEHLVEVTPPGDPLFVPPYEEEDAGVKIPRDLLPLRYVKSKDKYYYSRYSPKSRDLILDSYIVSVDGRGNATKLIDFWPRGVGSFLRKIAKTQPDQLKKHLIHFRQKYGTRYRVYNPFRLLLGMTGGYIRNNRAMVRVDQVRYNVQHVEIEGPHLDKPPFFNSLDYPLGSAYYSREGWHRWRTYAYVYFCNYT